MKKRARVDTPTGILIKPLGRSEPSASTGYVRDACGVESVVVAVKFLLQLPFDAQGTAPMGGEKLNDTKRPRPGFTVKKNSPPSVKYDWLTQTVASCAVGLPSWLDEVKAALTQKQAP